MAKSDVYSKAASSMSGKSKSSSKGKEISHITVKAGASGGHAITHHHTDPEKHADETHIAPNKAAMLAHMAANAPDNGPTPDATGAPDATAGAPDPNAAAAAPAAG